MYEISGDSEAFGLSTLLAIYSGVASIVFLSEVLDIFAIMNASMQRKLADFSKLPLLLKAMTDQLEYMKVEKSGWLCSVETEISQLKEKYDISLATHHGSIRSRWSSITTIADHGNLAAIPYVDALLENIKTRLMVMSSYQNGRYLNALCYSRKKL